MRAHMLRSYLSIEVLALLSKLGLPDELMYDYKEVLRALRKFLVKEPNIGQPDSCSKRRSSQTARQLTNLCARYNSWRSPGTLPVLVPHD